MQNVAQFLPWEFEAALRWLRAVSPSIDGKTAADWKRPQDTQRQIELQRLAQLASQNLDVDEKVSIHITQTTW